MAGRKFDAVSTVFAWVIVAFIFLAICVVVFGIRLVITGGEAGLRSRTIRRCASR